MITEDTYRSHEAFAREFIVRHCIDRGDMPGRKRGSRYSWLLSLRRGLMNPDFLRAVSEMMLWRLETHLGGTGFQVCGAETAGIPLAVGIPIMARIHGVRISGFTARRERRSYGLLNDHEGMVTDQPYVLVDDMCNSSESLARADHVCRSVLALPSAETAIVIVNKSRRDVHSRDRLSGDMYLPRSVSVLSLFTLDDIGLSRPSH